MAAIKVNDRLLTRYVAKEVNAQEKKRVEEWATRSEKNQFRLNEWLTVMRLYGDLPAADPLTQEELNDWWISLNRRMKQPDTKPGLLIPAWFEIAALVILFVGLTTIGYFNIHPQLPATHILKLYGDGIRKDTLNDGSQVLLGTGSLLLFNSSLYGRDAELEGSGFFEVQHDSTKPFRVHTRGITVTDIGTSFLIQSDSGATRIKLLSGKAAISTRRHSIRLQAGDSVHISLNGSILPQLPSPGSSEQKQRLSRILKDIKRQHLIKDSIQWFVLTNELFFINGSRQPKKVFQRFKTKFPLAKDSSLIYGSIRLRK